MKRYKFFENRECEFYPCHDLKEINCLFCYCPFLCADCSDFGNPEYFINSEGVEVKDCSNCIYPHKRENYDEIVLRLRKLYSTKTPIGLDRTVNERRSDEE